MVTTRIIGFNFQQFHVLSAECTYVFCMVLRTLTFSVCSIKSFVFITEMECVYCAVRPVSLTKTFLPFVVK